MEDTRTSTITIFDLHFASVDIAGDLSPSPSFSLLHNPLPDSRHTPLKQLRSLPPILRSSGLSPPPHSPDATPTVRSSKFGIHKHHKEEEEENSECR
jgi:hypothetical protein